MGKVLSFILTWAGCTAMAVLLYTGTTVEYINLVTIYLLLLYTLIGLVVFLSPIVVTLKNDYTNKEKEELRKVAYPSEVRVVHNWLCYITTVILMYLSGYVGMIAFYIVVCVFTKVMCKVFTIPLIKRLVLKEGEGAL